MPKRLIGSSDASASLGLDIARGVLPNVTWVNKFGFNPEMDSGDGPTDVWEFGKSQPEYVFPVWGTAPIDRLSSDNAADTMDVGIQGLDINGVLTEQTITLNGVTPVALTTPLWRCFRMWNADLNLATGQGTKITGVVYCFEDSAVTAGVPDDSSKVRAIIVDGNNQTQMGIYTIPKGLTGYFVEGGAGIARDSTRLASAVLQLRMRLFGGAFRVQKTISASTGGTSSFQEQRMVATPIPELTDVLVTCQAVTENGIALWGSIEIILIDEEAEEAGV